MKRETLQFLRTAALCWITALVLSAMEPCAQAVLTGTCNGWTDDTSNLTWVLDDEGTLTISGTGTIGTLAVDVSPTEQAAKQQELRNNTRHVVINEGATWWDNDVVLLNLPNLKSLTVPASLGNLPPARGIIYLHITGSGPMKALYSDCLAALEEGVETTATVDIDEGITEVNDMAFTGATRLAHIRIPESLTKIGFSAFRGCKNLQAINQLPPSAFNEALRNIESLGRDAFENCESLKGELTLPKKLTSLPAKSFAGCVGLTKVVIPDNGMNIHYEAFYGCTGITAVDLPISSMERFFDGLESLAYVKVRASADGTEKLVMGSHDYGHPVTVELEEGISQIPAEMFAGPNITANIPESVTRIGDGAFSGCAISGKLDLKNVTEIGKAAFANCTGIQGELAIPNGMTSINNDAFKGCTGITSISFPDSLTDIGYRAFEGCTGLASVILPDSLTTVANDAFQNCSNLDDFSFPASAMNSNSLSGCEPSVLRVRGSGILTPGPWGNIRRGKELTVEIEGGFTEIGKSAFAGAGKMVKVTIPDSVSVIGESAFRECVGLTELPRMDGVSKFEDYAFFDCTGLTSLTFPDNVSEFGRNVFAGCTGLTSVVIPETSKAQTLSGAFSDCSNIQSVTVPARLAGNFGYGCTSITSIKVTGGGDMEDGSDYSDGGFWNSSLEAGNKVTLELPDGLTSIGKNAFLNCSGDLSIKIPDSVTHIGDSAFRNCSVVIGELNPAEWTYIGESAFVGCTGVTIKPNFEKLTYVGGSAFANCTWLEGEPVFRAAELSIGWETFENCSGLSGMLDLPNNTDLGYNAFKNCTGFTGVALHSKIMHVNAFDGCTGLTLVRIKTNTDSSTYVIHGGVHALWMIASTAGNNVTVEIGEGNNLDTSDIFKDCVNLVSVSIPKDIHRIGASVFSGCSNLKEVHYYGTRKNWQDMRIGEGNEPFQKATVIFETAGEVQLERISVESGEVSVTVSDIPQAGTSIQCMSVFCAIYNTSGKMIAVRSAQITGESNYQFQFDGQQFDYAKAFIVDGNFRPLCESKKS